MSEFDDIEVQVTTVLDTEVEELVSVFSDSIGQLTNEILPLVKELVEPVVPVFRAYFYRCWDH